MPYEIKKEDSGYKVCKQSGKCFSRKPLTLRKAKAQLRAIQANTTESLRECQALASSLQSGERL